MASSLRVSFSFRCSSACGGDRLFVGQPRPALMLPRHAFCRSSVPVFARRRGKTNSAITSSSSSSKKKKNMSSRGDDLDEDAFDALFHQLEDDLKNDGVTITDEDDSEIDDEDLKKFEHELTEALGDDDLLGAFEDEETDNEHEEEEEGEKEEEDDEEEEQRLAKLKTWQLRRLGYALKMGRRKISIKNLAGELGLDRSLVLELLRDPPPNLLMLSAALPDKPVSILSESQTEPKTESMETASVETTTVDVEKSEEKVELPVHEMQSNWSAQKRLKKVHVETLERIYERTKHPTNAMVSSIVHVTSIPRKRVLKWFEDKRADDGVPSDRLPYRRSTPQTSSS